MPLGNGTREWTEETVIWCAKHSCPYVALAIFLEPTVELWNM